jgi:hypothetical protein
MAISPLNLQILGITAPSFRQVVIANHNGCLAQWHNMAQPLPDEIVFAYTQKFS